MFHFVVFATSLLLTAISVSIAVYSSYQLNNILKRVLFFAADRISKKTFYPQNYLKLYCSYADDFDTNETYIGKLDIPLFLQFNSDLNIPAVLNASFVLSIFAVIVTAGKIIKFISMVKDVGVKNVLKYKALNLFYLFISIIMILSNIPIYIIYANRNIFFELLIINHSAINNCLRINIKYGNSYSATFIYISVASLYNFISNEYYINLLN